jgi:hypothetical protein
MKDVLITRERWLGGTNAKWSRDFEIHQKAVGESWEDIVDAVLWQAAARAREQRCNAILGAEILVDPYERTIHFVGTPAFLEPILGGEFDASSYGAVTR